jgi:hypothetical protein
MLSRPEVLLTPHYYPLLNKAQHLLKQVATANKTCWQQSGKQAESIKCKQKGSNTSATQHKQLMTSGYSADLAIAVFPGC